MDMYAFPQGQSTSTDVPSDPIPRNASHLPEDGDHDLDDGYDYNDLGPIQTPWSPLGDDEHDFSNFNRASRPSTTDSSAWPPSTATQPAAPHQHELTLLCGPTPGTLAPHHRVNVIGDFYSTLHALLTPHNSSGLIGTFRTAYDFTPSITWKDFLRAFREEAVRRGLPASIDTRKGERLTVWITAKVVVRKGKKVKEKFLELGKEGWFEGIGDLVRYGGREVRVGYFMSGEEERRADGKGEGRKEVGRRRQGMSMLDARALLVGN